MKTARSDDRPKQELAPEVVGRLMALVRGQFCGDFSDKEWFTHAHFVKRNVVLWPAHYIMDKRNFTLPMERYEEIMREIFDGVKGHGTSAPIRYWPGYLMKCVQDHWQHNWETYYEEAKSVRNRAEAALVNLGKVLPVDRGVEALAAAHGVLAGRRPKRRVAKVRDQGSLFPL